MLGVTLFPLCFTGAAATLPPPKTMATAHISGGPMHGGGGGFFSACALPTNVAARMVAAMMALIMAACSYQDEAQPKLDVIKAAVAWFTEARYSELFIASGKNNARDRLLSDIAHSNRAQLGLLIR